MRDLGPEPSTAAELAALREIEEHLRWRARASTSREAIAERVRMSRQGVLYVERRALARMLTLITSGWEP
jgi:hypothetical protein